MFNEDKERQGERRTAGRTCEYRTLSDRTQDLYVNMQENRNKLAATEEILLMLTDLLELLIKIL